MGTRDGGRGTGILGSHPSPVPRPPSPWVLIVDSDGRPAAENMALDEALLVEADRTGAAFLRLYRWTPPALSFGRNEPALARYDRAAIERLGLAVVRRPTGGRAVWHEHEITYAVAAPATAFASLRDTYRAIHARLATALRALGAPAELAPDGHPNGGNAGPLPAGGCFATSVGGEITIRGRKIVGSAQVRRATAFLQHGSILLDGSQDVIARVSRRPGPPPAATTLAAALGRPVSFEEVTQVIVSTWGGGVTWTALDHARPSSTVLDSRPSSTVFGDPAWTWRR